MTPAQAALQAALSLQQRGDLAAAESAYRDLLERFGPNPDAEHMLGLTLHAAGRSEESLPWFERAAQVRGGPTLWNNHAAALLAVGRAREAADLARRVVGADPKNAGAWLNLGLAREIEGKLGEAVAALTRALSLSPKNAAAERALTRCELADNRRAVVKESSLRIGRGETETGLAALRTWLDSHPHDEGVAGTYLFACNYSERMSPATLLAEHSRLAPICDLNTVSTKKNFSGSPAKQTKIGWIRDSFGADLTKIFLEDVLRAFPDVAPDFEHVLYAVGGNIVSPSSTPTWAATQHDVSRLSDQQLIDRIGNDGVDVLIDLMGRTTGNRVSIFAARAAPIQIGWLDVFYPSGLETMDYLVTDPWLSPVGADAHFSERLLRLPHGRLAYSPPPVRTTNANAAGLKQFVSLNRFSKLNDAVIDVWASILRALPEWTLLLKARGRDDDLAARFLFNFADAGVDPARVAIEDGGTYADAMAAYDRASIALDPFPFSGCSTTCDALWMGLPVITWPRETIASRQTAAWLEMAGKPEWIAHNADSYVDLAIRLAGDEAFRSDWRRDARDVLRPTICDSARLARELADAIRSAVRSRH